MPPLHKTKSFIAAGASIFRFAQCQVCFANIAPALRYDSIITQIGRKSNISAEILLLRTVEDACPYKCCVKLPYEKEPNSRPFLIHFLGIFLPKLNQSLKTSQTSLPSTSFMGINTGVSFRSPIWLLGEWMERYICPSVS